MTILIAENINKKIRGKELLKNINLSLGQGEIIGLIGENGAGKTTLMNVLLGLTDYQSGVMRVEGKEVPNLNHSSIKIGALIEQPGIYPFLTGYDNLKLFHEGSDSEEINQIINDLNMSEYIHKKAKTYSLGMKQKLGVALSFLNHPKMIFLDEPMNGLDPQAIRDVRNAILKRADEGVSFFISSHILSELEKVTNTLLILNNGEIISETTVEEIKKDAEDGDLETAFLQILDEKRSSSGEK
ncbi:ATP-binding cassette domain-containing protein [Alkalibacillus almallahensis]|uniref:ATP-binding cassette domain-containing protein n=1 Tax=Alkalibacillus almallahensis TaxID=1379154 RepID=UPI00141E2956|nr:ABC-2 type transport system ATP-binding protein [Alkalibacillus almallahensis]